MNKTKIRGVQYMSKEKPRKKINFCCFNCKHKDNVEELEERGYVERIGSEQIVIECEKCGEFTYICHNKGYKGHKIN